MSREKEPLFECCELVKEKFKGLYGMDPEQSLLSVHFATTENTYLNEHYQQDPKDENSIENE